MKKQFLKYITGIFSSVMIIIYILSSFNYEILELSHKLLHSLSHKVEVFHDHDIENHNLNEETHNHGFLALLFIDDDHKNSKEETTTSEKKSLDNHFVPKLIRSYKPIDYTTLKLVILDNNYLYNLLNPITPPPEIHSC